MPDLQEKIKQYREMKRLAEEAAADVSNALRLCATDTAINAKDMGLECLYYATYITWIWSLCEFQDMSNVRVGNAVKHLVHRNVVVPCLT